MTSIDYFREDIWVNVTWTLAHFVWQGAVIAAGTALMLRAWSARQASHRYAVCMVSMMALAVAPLATMLYLHALERTPVAQRQPRLPFDKPASAIPEGAEAQSPVVPPRSQVGTTPQRDWQAPSDAQPDGQSWFSASTNLLVRVLQPWITVAWLAGVLLFSARLVIGFFGVRAIRRAAQPADAELLRITKTFAKRIGIKTTPLVAISEVLADAITTGFLRPVILLPAPWVSGLSPGTLEAIVAHELAHVARCDVWFNLAQRIVETLLFFHPAVWWISGRMRLEREMCCDRAASDVTGRRVIYARALEVAGQSGYTAPTALAAGGGRRKLLLYRVRHVLGMPTDHEPTGWLAAGLVALAVPVALAIGSTSASFDRLGVAASTLDGDALAQDFVKPVERIRPLDVLRIEILGQPDVGPVLSEFLVEPDGLVSLGPNWGRISLEGMTVEEAQREIEARLEQNVSDAQVQVTRLGKPRYWSAAVVPQAPYRIKSGDDLHVMITGDPETGPISKVFRVEPSGKLALGARNGRVEVAGLTLEDAGNAIQEDLKERLLSPQVAITLGDPKMRAIAPPRTGRPHRIGPGDSLWIAITGDPETGPIISRFVVEPSGAVCLGPRYGHIVVAGKTLTEAENAIENKLEQTLQDARVAVTLAGWQMDEDQEDRIRMLEDEVARLQDTIKKMRPND